MNEGGGALNIHQLNQNAEHTKGSSMKQVHVSQELENHEDHVPKTLRFSHRKVPSVWKQKGSNVVRKIK